MAINLRSQCLIKTEKIFFVSTYMETKSFKLVHAKFRRKF